ncbi:MAG: helix-turn-helix domain-containing protein [Acidobacteriia bacterium]|nr:helix-turn-helix domain-containing protein [Terriglobia bacterium]
MVREEVPAVLYRVRDVCRLLSLPSSTVYRMVHNGQLRAVQMVVSPDNPRGVVRIPKGEVDRLLGAIAEGGGR